MIEKIKELLDTLQKELNTSEIDMAQCTLYETQKQVNELKQGLEQGKTYVNGAQATLYELQKQLETLEQGLRVGKNFSLLGDNN